MAYHPSYRDYIQLFDVFNEAIIIYDSERVHWVNYALVTLLEYDSRDEIIGKNILSLIEIESKQEATHQLKRLCSGVKRTGGVYTAIKKDGSHTSVVSRGTHFPAVAETLLISIVRPVDEDPVDGGRVWSDFRVKHEISSSLTVIKGYVELLKEKTSISDDHDLGKWFDTIFENLERIEKILLDIA